MTAFDLNRGALAPVADEVDLVDLRVSGAIPHELAGTLLRNGPNPPGGRFEGSDVLSWWPEAAMLHAIAFEGGRATGYRNRWARTQRWAAVHPPGEARQLPATNPNVSVLPHAGELPPPSEGVPPFATPAALAPPALPAPPPGLRCPAPPPPHAPRCPRPPTPLPPPPPAPRAPPHHPRTPRAASSPPRP
ncbi:hypothetical protein DWU95_41605, partial [Burkholderia contaminans]